MVQNFSTKIRRKKLLFDNFFPLPISDKFMKQISQKVLIANLF